MEILAISLWKGFSKFRDAGREDCLCCEQDHPEFPLQEEGQSRRTECSETGPVSSRKTDRRHDVRLLSDDGDLISVTLRDHNVQEFDTRWNEILLSTTKIPPDDILESLYKLRIRGSDQLKNSVRTVRRGDSSEDIKA